MHCIPLNLLKFKPKTITNNDRDSIETPSTSLALRAQKKILGKIGNRVVVKHFVNDTTLRIFDNLYKILKEFYNKNTAEKTINNILKIAIKLSALMREEHLNSDQKFVYNEFQKKLKSVILTVISFTVVDYSYDRIFLISQLEKVRELLATVVATTLSEKSVKKVDRIFDCLVEPRLLDEMFVKKGQFHDQLVQIVHGLENIIDGKDL
uniref:Tumor necrosis factor alpha-induced protein 8-like protein n=1 Tax=Panagrolaimus sp. JU765 TaxID=591449 RepID=A0AC34Q7M7_9BILA